MTVRDNAQAVYRRLALVARVGIVSAIVVLFLWWGGLFAGLSSRLNNIYYAPRPTSGNVVIIAVDDESLGAYGRSLVEWPRTLHARLVDILSQAGARVIAFDVLFSERAPGDEEFARAIIRARRDTDARTRTVMPIVGVRRIPSSVPGTVEYEYAMLPVVPLRSAVSMLGSPNMIMDVEGLIRWQPMRVLINGTTWLSFSASVYMSYLRIPPEAIPQLVQLDDGLLRLTPERQIPVDHMGRMMLNYFGAPGDQAFPVYSYRSVLEGEVPPDAFDDKIVLVGQMNATGMADMYPVPIGIGGVMMSGVEIHANAIETIIQGFPLRQQSAPVQIAEIVALAFLFSALYSLFHWRWGVLVMLVGLAAWIFIALVYFNLTGEMIDLLYTSLAVIAPLFGVLNANVTFERRLRRRAEMLLESMIKASTRQMSLEDILADISGDVCRLLDCHCSEVWLWDGDEGVLRRAYPPDEDEVCISGGGPGRECAERRLEDETRSLALDAIKAGEIVSCAGIVAAPLIWQGKPLGVLLAKMRGRMSPDRREVLGLFAWQTSSVIANVNLYTEAKRLSDFKTRLLRMASHDLKNPLLVISGYAEMLQDANVLTGAYAKYLDGIMTAANDMASIVNDILSLERIRRGALHMERCDLLSILRDVVARQEPGFWAKKQELIADLPESLPVLRGDAVQLREAFGNLLSNASKYTPDGGRITLRAYREDDHVHVEVEDTGYGIPESEIPNLFQEFYRVRMPETSRIRGTGLGLSLVKAVIEAHGGRVWAESKLGEGSVFHVVLPVDLGENGAGTDNSDNPSG